MTETRNTGETEQGVTKRGGTFVPLKKFNPNCLFLFLFVLFTNKLCFGATAATAD